MKKVTISRFSLMGDQMWRVEGAGDLDGDYEAPDLTKTFYLGEEERLYLALYANPTATLIMQTEHVVVEEKVVLRINKPVNGTTDCPGH